jgi:hypothetical protein
MEGDVGDGHRFTGELVPIQIGSQSSVSPVKGSGYRFGRSAQCSSEVTMGSVLSTLSTHLAERNRSQRHCAPLLSLCLDS